MKVHIALDRCQGHGVCVVTAPDLFELGADDRAHVLSDVVGPGELDGARAAEASCPEQAITVEEGT